MSERCTRIEPWRWGTVFLDAGFPDVPDSNFLSIEGVAADEAPDRVVAEVERVRAEVGIPHRRAVVPDAELVHRLAPAFEGAGWRTEQYLLMVQRRGAAMADDAPEAGEVSVPALLRFRDELEAETGATGESLRTRRAYAEKIHRSIGTRCFLAWIGPRAVSGCVLWMHADHAQLDAVATLPVFRGRGAAGAVIEAAIGAGRASGASWIHLYTLTETGPVRLYRRLGYDEVGRATEFVGA